MLPRPFLPFAILLAFFVTLLPAQQDATAPPADGVSAQIPVWGESGEQKFQSGDLEGAIQDFQKAFEASRELRQQYPDELAYSDNAYFYLGRLASVFEGAGKNSEAVQMAEPGARGYAEMARNDPASEDYKGKATDALGALAWYQMLNNDAAAAQASAREALQFTPDSLRANVNLAHALLLTGKRGEAEAIYKSLRALTLADGRTMREVILEDFDAMEEAGIRNAAIPEQRQMLGAGNATGAKRQPKADPPVWLFVVGIFLFVGALFAFLLYLERKRTAKIVAAAQALGLTLRAKTTPEDKALIQGAGVATVGRSRAVQNVIELPETDNTRMTVFDYTYVVGHGKRSHTSNQTITRVESPKLNLPTFDMRPEGIFSKIAQGFGGGDIDFAEAPTFSSRYFLRGEDETAIRRLFTPEILRFCEQHRGWWISGSGSHLWFHRENVRPKPENLSAFIETAHQTAALFIASSSAATLLPPPLPPR